MQMNDLTFLPIAQERCYRPMSTNFGPDRRNWPTPPSDITLAFQSGQEDRNADANDKMAITRLHLVEI